MKPSNKQFSSNEHVFLTATHGVTTPSSSSSVTPLSLTCSVTDYLSLGEIPRQASSARVTQYTSRYVITLTERGHYRRYGVIHPPGPRLKL